MNGQSNGGASRFSPEGGGIWWPDSWVSDLGNIRRNTISVGVFAGLFLLGLIALPAEGRVISLAGIALLGPLALEGVIQMRSQHRSTRSVRLRRGGRSSGTGVFLSTSISSEVSFLLLLISVASFCLGSPWLAQIMAASQAGYFNAVFQAVAPWLPILSLVAVPFLLSPIIRGFKRMGVVLTPEGVVHQSWFGRCSYTWDGIVEIDGDSRPFVIQLRTATGGRAMPGSKESWLSRRLRSGMRSIPAISLAVNPSVALRAIQFYHQHPELRTELSSDSAIRRIRRAGFTP